MKKNPQSFSNIYLPVSTRATQSDAIADTIADTIAEYLDSFSA